MGERKSEGPPGAANGPFVLEVIGGPERFGKVSQATTAPLEVELVARDKRRLQPPGEVEWTIVAGPPGADLGGSGSRVVTSVDALGHASISMRLSERPGAWRVRASLVGIPNSVDAYFRVYSDAVVSSLTVLRVDPTPVDRPLDVFVLATDWLGAPVTRAKLAAAIALNNAPPKGGISTNARGGKDGRYQLRLPWPYAGEYDVTVGDTLGQCSVAASFSFLPGAARKLRLHAVENPRLRPPYDRTVLTVDALDRFGNLTKPPGRLIWQASSGRVERIAAEPGAAGCSLLVFDERSSSTVTVRSGKLSARRTVELPGVLLRRLSGRNFVSPGQRFRFSVEVFAPAGGGILKAVDISLKQPHTARRIALRQPDPANGLPAARARDAEDGSLQLMIGRSELPLPEEPMRFVVAELEYECCEVGEACFAVLTASMTIDHSPDRDHPLNPKMTEYCESQKPDHPKRLCVQFCLVTKPDDPNRTFEKLKAEAQKQVDKAQEVFDKNLPICCPKIQINACFDEFKWADYQPLTQGDPEPGEMTGLEYPQGATGPNPDKTKDACKVTDKTKQLLKKCRKPNCHTFYFLPSFENKYGDKWKSAPATTISPNDFPETTGAAGSGSGTLVGGTPRNDTMVVHELGHALIDLPRDEDNGDEHSGAWEDPTRVMYAKGGDKRSVFTKEECSHIFDNIDKYGGDCS